MRRLFSSSDAGRDRHHRRAHVALGLSATDDAVRSDSLLGKSDVVRVGPSRSTERSTSVSVPTFCSIRSTHVDDDDHHGAADAHCSGPPSSCQTLSAAGDREQPDGGQRGGVDDGRCDGHESRERRTVRNCTIARDRFERVEQLAVAERLFSLPAAVAPVIAEYVTEGFDFLAMKLLPDQGVTVDAPGSRDEPRGVAFAAACAWRRSEQAPPSASRSGS